MRIPVSRPCQDLRPDEVRLYDTSGGVVTWAPAPPRLDVTIDAPDLVARIRDAADVYQHTPRRLVIEVLDKVFAGGAADLVGAVLGER